MRSWSSRTGISDRRKREHASCGRGRAAAPSGVGRRRGIRRSTSGGGLTCFHEESVMEARALDLLPDPELDPEAFYHPHEEDRVPVSGMHDAITLYMESALGVYRPDHWVAADLCCYRIQGNNRVYLGPDVFVAGPPT